MAKPWIVRHRDGWCALPPGAEPDPEAWSDPTLCGHVVNLRSGTGNGKPDCPDCLAVLAGTPAAGEVGSVMTGRSMFRYMVPVDDHPHGFRLTGGPVAVAATEDGRTVEFWAEHAPATGPVPLRAFRVFGTGHPLPDDARWAGTCQRTPAGLVWHLYEVAPGPAGEGDL